ncbi:hypothetical protein Plec18167_005846 [Paecilomyces lecythidis]|uniref:Uncharacterized protein n=1 Tax=Paecilomyces lecythidis TaxID=3004212 RepID=A0ABR3XF88_9EURO
MVLGIVMMTTMIPTIVGLNEATNGARDEQRRKNNNEDKGGGNDRQNNQRKGNSRKQRFHLQVTCSDDSGSQEMRQQVHNAKVYVKTDGKIYISKHPSADMDLFNGGFYTHPSFPPDNTAGFVTISPEKPPILRWVFLDADTHQMRWGSRPDSQGHICGPFDWTNDEERITLEGWEGWLAVQLPEDERESGIWRLYFDRDDNGAQLPAGSRGLEICMRRE